MLDFTGLSKEVRSNSYIENYNRRIKLKLSKLDSRIIIIR